VLLRLSHRSHPQHSLIATAMRRWVARNVELCFTPQNLGEFWNATTRPPERYGFGLSIQETKAQVQSIERTMTLLSEDERVYRVWCRLLLHHDVQVHDAHLAAVLEVYGVTHLLTFNGTDCKRFSSLIAVHPQEEQP
jgi:predicted nucleic acid-binding protein